METEPQEKSLEQIEAEVLAVIKEIYDPEIPVNIHDLGLIYELRVNPDRTVLVRMTLTAPNCPAAGFLPGQVEDRIKNHPDVVDARVELTFTPPYHQDMMSDVAKLELGFM